MPAKKEQQATTYGLLTEVGDLGLGFNNDSNKKNEERIKKELNKNNNKSNS